MRVRVCVECGEEFRPDVLRCSDCGGALVDQWDADRQDGEGAEQAPSLDSGSAGSAFVRPSEPQTRPLAWAQQARDLVPAADLLRAAALTFHIAPRQAEGEERPRGYELRVRDGDREKAWTALSSALAADSGITLLETPVTDSPMHDHQSRCPACETEVAAGIAECPSCGLGLGNVGPED